MRGMAEEGNWGPGSAETNLRLHEWEMLCML